jgi:deoxyribodipyrimidine photo-lyase
LRHQRRWRSRVAAEAPCAVVEVEADTVVPVEIAAEAAQVAARTLRPRLQRCWDDFLVPLPARRPARGWDRRRRGGPGLRDLDRLLAGLDIDGSVAPVSAVHPGGTTAALARLRRFLAGGLRGYAGDRRGADHDSVSRLSMYLHFGQIAPVEVALAARARTGIPAGDREAFLEELIVRRELAQNFCWYTPDYDGFGAVPRWARATLRAHATDPRPRRYDADELERAQTDDPIWNTAMREMIATGYLHNRLRMYWGKKILEWTSDPAEAHRVALRLNNRYFLDGRDPSSYANVSWIFGLHDRPFGERPVFGTVRSMTAAGLERKLDVERYQQEAEARIARAVSA